VEGLTVGEAAAHRHLPSRARVKAGDELFQQPRFARSCRGQDGNQLWPVLFQCPRLRQGKLGELPIPPHEGWAFDLPGRAGARLTPGKATAGRVARGMGRSCRGVDVALAIHGEPQGFHKVHDRAWVGGVRETLTGKICKLSCFPGLEQIGTNTIKRVLEDAGSSYQKTRSWCPTGTAQRVRKSGVVTVVDPETEQKRG
jgi:hypothetical protein